MSSNTENAGNHHSQSSIPWFGARKRELEQELTVVRADRDKVQAQLERFASMGHQLVAEVKALRSDREMLRTQLEALGGLSVVELEARRASLQKETDEQAAR